LKLTWKRTSVTPVKKGDSIMPAKNPRVNIVIDRQAYSALLEIASAQDMPLAMVARDLIKEALELREDAALVAFAEDRENSFNPATALTHEEVWG
jgi:hypothetical protein